MIDDIETTDQEERDLESGEYHKWPVCPHCFHEHEKFYKEDYLADRISMVMPCAKCGESFIFEQGVEYSYVSCKPSLEHENRDLEK